MIDRQSLSWGNSGRTASRQVLPFEVNLLAAFSFGNSELNALFSLEVISVQLPVACKVLDPNHLITRE